MSRRKSSSAVAPPIMLDASIPDTPAKICDKMIEILIEEKEDKDKELISILSQCKDFSLVVTTFDNKIKAATELPIQLKYFLLFLDILKEHFAQKGNDTTDQLNKELLLISNFKQPLTTSTLYDELRFIIETIFSKYSNISSDTLYNLLSPTNGPYYPLIISIYESRTKSKNSSTFLRAFQLATDKFDSSSPTSVIALSIIFQSSKLTNLSKEEKNVFDSFGGVQKTREIIKQLVEGTTTQQMVSIRMIQGLTNFLDADEAFKHLIEVLKHVIAILNRSEDSIRLDVARMIKDIPPNCDESIMTQEEQIKSILAPCCEHLDSFEGDYAEALMNFTNDRRGYKKFNELIMAMFASYNTSYAALLFALRFDLLTPEMIKAAFPKPPVPDNRIHFSVIGAKFLIENNKFDYIVFKRVLAQILNAVHTESFLKNEKLLAVAYEGIDALMPYFNKFYFKGCKVVLNQMQTAHDHRCLQHFANGCKSLTLSEIKKYLAKNSSSSQQKNQSTDQNSPYVADPSNYSKFFCSHFLFLLDKDDFDEVFFQLLRVFSPSITEKPINYFNIIPENCKEKLKSYANSKLKNEPKYSIVCALYPRMKDKEIHSLVKIATSVQPFDPIFYDKFFYYLSTVYLKQTLKELDDLSTGKKLATSVFTGKKKKQERHLLVTTTLALIPKLIEYNELTGEQQNQVYKIVASSLPKKPHKILKIADESKKMNEVFLKLPSANPPKELSQRLLPLTIFVESMPILIKPLKVNDDLVETMVKTYIHSLSEDPKSFEKTKPIIHTIIKASKNPGTVNLILKEASKNFSFYHQSKSDNNSENQALHDDNDLAFCSVCKNCLLENQALDVGFTDVVPYILALAPLPLSDNLEIRTTAFEAYHAFIGFEPKTPIRDLVGIKLSPAQLKSEVIQLFSLIATKIEIEKCSQIIKTIYKMKDISYPHAILLRSFLSSRSDYLENVDTKNHLTKIIQNHKDFTKSGEVELEKGLMKLALLDMKKLIPIILNVPHKSSYRSHILLMLLTSASHRELFLDNYHKLLVKCDMKSVDTMKYFIILPMIIDTEESTDMTALTFGTMVAEIIMLIAYAYSNNNSKDFGKSNIKQATDIISHCLEKLFTKTQLEKKAKYNVNVNDITSVSDTIKKIAKIVTTLEVEKIQVLHQRCNIMLQSQSQSVLLVAGILNIHLFADFIDYKNSEANDLNETLSHEIAETFNVSNNMTRRYLASLMPLEKTGHFKEEDIKKIFVAMSSSLAEANEKQRLKATEFYTIVITNEFIDKATIVSEIENLNNVLKNSFSQLEPSISIMKILSRFLEGRCDIADFTGEAPNIKSLILIGATSGKNVEMGQMAWDDLNLLKGNSKSISDSINNIFNTGQLREIASSIMMKTDDTELLSVEWFDLVCDIIVSVITGRSHVNSTSHTNSHQSNGNENQQSEIDQFNKNALRYVMPSVSKVNSIHHQKAAEVLKIIWQ